MVSVTVHGPDDLPRALKRLQRRMVKEGVFIEMKKREFYRKPSEERKRKRLRAERYRRRENQRRQRPW